MKNFQQKLEIIFFEKASKKNILISKLILKINKLKKIDQKLFKNLII